jgi:hypothetical protein
VPTSLSILPNTNRPTGPLSGERGLIRLLLLLTKETELAIFEAPIAKTALKAHSESGKGDAAITSTLLGNLNPGMKRSQMLALTVPYVVPGLWAKPAK